MTVRTQPSELSEDDALLTYDQVQLEFAIAKVCARRLGDGFGRRQVDGTRVGGGWWRRVMTIA